MRNRGSKAKELGSDTDKLNEYRKTRSESVILQNAAENN